MPFKKGQSGNPGGVNNARKDKQIRELLLADVPAAVEAIRDCLQSDNPLPAAKEILDRVYGKAAQSLDIGGEASAAMAAVLQIIAKK